MELRPPRLRVEKNYTVLNQKSRIANLKSRFANLIPRGANPKSTVNYLG